MLKVVGSPFLWLSLGLSVQKAFSRNRAFEGTFHGLEARRDRHPRDFDPMRMEANEEIAVVDHAAISNLAHLSRPKLLAKL